MLDDFRPQISCICFNEKLLCSCAASAANWFCCRPKLSILSWMHQNWDGILHMDLIEHRPFCSDLWQF